MKAELHIVGILFCVFASAFFSGTETGLLSLNHARLMHLVRGGVKSAQILHEYLGDLQRCLATLLVGNNLVNVMLSTLSASLARTCFPDRSGLQAVWATGVAFLMRLRVFAQVVLYNPPVAANAAGVRPFMLWIAWLR